MWIMAVARRTPPPKHNNREDIVALFLVSPFFITRLEMERENAFHSVCVLKLLKVFPLYVQRGEYIYI